jgi:hypothetical protein
VHTASLINHAPLPYLTFLINCIWEKYEKAPELT